MYTSVILMIFDATGNVTYSHAEAEVAPCPQRGMPRVEYYCITPKYHPMVPAVSSREHKGLAWLMGMLWWDD